MRRVLLYGSVVLLIGFWIWALFFASKEAVNKIGDEAWAARAETICADTRVQLRALDAEASGDLGVRAGLVDTSTGLLASSSASRMGPIVRGKSVPGRARLDCPASTTRSSRCSTIWSR